MQSSQINTSSKVAGISFPQIQQQYLPPLFIPIEKAYKNAVQKSNQIPLYIPKSKINTIQFDFLKMITSLHEVVSQHFSQYLLHFEKMDRSSQASIIDALSGGVIDTMNQVSDIIFHKEKEMWWQNYQVSQFKEEPKAAFTTQNYYFHVQNYRRFQNSISFEMYPQVYSKNSDGDRVISTTCQFTVVIEMYPLLVQEWLSTPDPWLGDPLFRLNISRNFIPKDAEKVQTHQGDPININNIDAIFSIGSNNLPYYQCYYPLVKKFVYQECNVLIDEETNSYFRYFGSLQEASKEELAFTPGQNFVCQNCDNHFFNFQIFRCETCHKFVCGLCSKRMFKPVKSEPFNMHCLCCKVKKSFQPPSFILKDDSHLLKFMVNISGQTNVPISKYVKEIGPHFWEKCPDTLKVFIFVHFQHLPLNTIVDSQWGCFVQDMLDPQCKDGFYEFKKIYVGEFLELSVPLIERNSLKYCLRAGVAAFQTKCRKFKYYTYRAQSSDSTDASY